ncbi:MAG: DNA polymerase III subunit gamma/tau [Acidobacteriaceae bacterium]|nr:DNA polymerase III subunit gamma/tau [Acidobacteriaceae bacterium]MBV9781454.1 DNA polymerase III subunit gamma/tau [Acidobacteriaceae bacterium]
MYQVIARKYRPQNFSELIGQEHVQKTLANAITSCRLAHGYIFSGQRGTGKTSVARILARCLNCINGPTVTPCGVCASCVEISNGNSVDVIEIDAASNRGINEMREIRENVRYRPARDRYKIFIVDEAHQITKEAFNALLKTLEEPPEWVVFILCTTEAHEIPNTIASRCQHFAFRSIDYAELQNRLREIAAQEDIEASDEVLSVIAQAGEGSVRDSLSALDQAIACCGKALRVEDVRALLGMFAVESLRSVAEAIHNQDSARMLDIVEELERSGQSLQHFCRELSRYWRNLLVAKISGKPNRLIAASEREQQGFLETAGLFGEEDLTRYLNLTLELYQTLQTSLQPRLHLEVGLIKLVQAGRLQSIEEALASLENPEPETSRAERLKPATFQTASSKANPGGEQNALNSTQSPVAPAGKPVEPVKSGDLATDLADALSRAGLETTADAVRQSELRLEGNELLVRAPKSIAFGLKDAGVQRVAVEVTGRPVRVRIEAREPMKTESPQTSGTSAPSENDVRQRALSHPGVKRFQELFPDAQVRTVRNLNE